MKIDGFMESLAKVVDSDDRWASLVAGLSCLRLAEEALREHTVSTHLHDFARRAVEQVASMELRPFFASVLEICPPGPVIARSVTRINLARTLTTYGMRLHSDGLFAPAADVLSFVETVVQSYDPELSLMAGAKAAYAFRLHRNFAAAEAAYRRVESRARAHRNYHLMLEAQLGLAKIELNRDDLPAAIPMVDAVIERAKQLREPQIVAKAYIDRAHIAGRRNEPIEAIAYSLAAIRLLQPGTDRDRCAVNIAYAMREIGLGTHATRQAWHVVTRGQDADQRAAATIILYNIAIDERDEATMRWCRASLADPQVSPVFEAEYYQALSYDHAVRGNFAEARLAAGRMLAIAEDHRLCELIINADEALEDLREERMPRINFFRPAIEKAAEAGHRLEEILAEAEALCPADEPGFLT